MKCINNAPTMRSLISSLSDEKNCVCVIFYWLLLAFEKIQMHSLWWLSEILKFHSAEKWSMEIGCFIFAHSSMHIFTSGTDGLAAIYLIYSMGLVSSLRKTNKVRKVQRIKITIIQIGFILEYRLLI